MYAFHAPFRACDPNLDREPDYAIRNVFDLPGGQIRSVNRNPATAAPNSAKASARLSRA
jgi:hypothetical protein